MEEHRNVERVKLAGEALNRGDPEPFLSFCSDDIVVHMSGKHRLSGTYQGKDALFALWQKMAEASGGTLQLSL